VGKNVSYRGILRHHANRMSQSQIATACGCARSTVQDVLKLAGGKGVSWDDVAGLSEQAAYELIRGRPRDQSEGFAKIDFEKVQREMERDRTIALSLLWEEYAMLAVRNFEKPYSYTRFYELHAAWCDNHDTAVTRKYIPGDLGEFDWAGKKMAVTDELTGELHDAWLFVACLPYSQKTLVAAYPNMEVETWCQASADAFSFYGGAPRLLTIDNLRASVVNHTPEEIVLNRTLREFAEHCNVAVIPHAPVRRAGRPRWRAASARSPTGSATCYATACSSTSTSSTRRFSRSSPT
jgi:transposase